MRVQLRMNYEMNRQLQADSQLSLADYDVLVALSGNRDRAMRVSDLAAQIGWERNRLSHQLRRMEERGLTERRPNAEDGRTSMSSSPSGDTPPSSRQPRHMSTWCTGCSSTRFRTTCWRRSPRRWNISTSTSISTARCRPHRAEVK
ncbi:MarR family winged helix-turn-helix transcriptional regulator [Mycobacterium adipatum]|uniref:MarR family winged helix-turn-helix transcriptional regulator n=1 Tax=Mycobacterium adipatum TaxID=1682113 RepID=UPI001E479FD0|nr:helix-turn-helix domain-containing protein [Mycobacterium adipatum]